MLTLNIAAKESFDDLTQSFITTKPMTLELEHSLISVSKWESKWCIPFLGKTPKTDEQTIDYIRHMTITRNVDPEVYLTLSAAEINAVADYITAPMTATTFYSPAVVAGKVSIITAEIVYYWMISLEIPSEYQKWHLNRLLTLVQVCNEKNSPPKKTSKGELAARNRALNAQRRQTLNTSG